MRHDFPWVVGNIRHLTIVLSCMSAILSMEPGALVYANPLLKTANRRGKQPVACDTLSLNMMTSWHWTAFFIIILMWSTGYRRANSKIQWHHDYLSLWFIDLKYHWYVFHMQYTTIDWKRLCLHILPYMGGICHYQRMIQTISYHFTDIPAWPQILGQHRIRWTVPSTRHEHEQLWHRFCFHQNDD